MIIWTLLTKNGREMLHEKVGRTMFTNFDSVSIMYSLAELRHSN